MIRKLDARGLICPLPVLKARKILLSLPPGEVLHVLVDDARAPGDFKLFCAESGHTLIEVLQQEKDFEIKVKASSARGKE